ncbi:MAG TPA: DUF2946 domain-containing protein [Dyella sp.]|uniref:DUF2946 domain-containing protein n=1 Tax=Dyella sp. TaxID=1869338 RepID=UPI002D785545|nr:DUF2946 domain-containing protein [Dyella sp.]HET6553582.1 DUF2946 domain-containing protein [Dyella sp.]
MTAIWLAIAAPVVSQVVVQDAMPSMAADCGGHRDRTPPLAPHPSSMDKCGYCTLLSHHPVLMGAAMPAAVYFPPATPVPFSDAPYDVGLSVLAAAPRGPPVHSQH